MVKFQICSTDFSDAIQNKSKNIYLSRQIYEFMVTYLRRGIISILHSIHCVIIHLHIIKQLYTHAICKKCGINHQLSLFSALFSQSISAASLLKSIKCLCWTDANQSCV